MHSLLVATWSKVELMHAFRNGTSSRIFLLAIAVTTIASTHVAAAAEPQRLLSNFTAPLPSTDAVRTAVDFEKPRFGLASARVDYRIDPKTRRVGLPVPERSLAFVGPGALKLWIEGNPHGHQVQPVVKHGVPATDAQGRRSIQGQQTLELLPVSLDSAEWKQHAFDCGKIPAGNVAWLHELRFLAPPPPKPPKPKPGEPVPPEPVPVFDGRIRLDDLTFRPEGTPVNGTVALTLVGPAARPFGPEIAWSLDVRSFVDRRSRADLRLTMTDRNDNVVVDRTFPVDLAPKGGEERKLDLAPENLHLYLPPFRVTGDLISGDLPELDAKVDQTIVMGNGLILFDDLSDVHGRWFASGMEGFNNSYAAGASQRAMPFTQTTTRISRVVVEPTTDEDRPTPPSRFALRWDFAGNATVFTGYDRWLPGNAYRLGVWVKGDGSGAKLHALALDYTDLGDFYEGGWKRIRNGERLVCTLDFEGWRYFEHDLPGVGVGTNEPTGSTDELDFPLELTGFRIEAAVVDRQPQPGSVQIGPVFARTQVPASDTLVAHLGYDDADHLYAPDRAAWCTVQNAWTTGSRRIDVRWTLLDRNEEPIASEAFAADVPGTQRKTFRIDLAKHAAAIAARPFPLELQVDALVAGEANVAAARRIALSRPDSSALVADFESDRGYLGLKARDLVAVPGPGELAAFTSAEQKHAGQRSLAIDWDREKQPRRFVSIDPPLPGQPTELSLWVHGDGSGALFYPLFGDRRGVRHGLAASQFDLFLGRTVDGPLQSAVRIDWEGWREIRFRLPLVPPHWRRELPVLGYLPSYPLGLHLAVDARGATTPSGRIFVDDVRVETHLPPAERLGLALLRADATNVVAPGGRIAAAVANRDAARAARATVVATVADWRGRRIAGGTQTVDVPAGSALPLVVADKLPVGAYALRLELQAGGKTLATLDDDLLVADLAARLGPEWRTALADEWKLRKAIDDRFTLLDEDWDWIEHFPGNPQVDSLRTRAGEVVRNGADPFVLLGYSAYWASEEGHRQLLTDSFVRPQRDIGHAVGIFMTPQRMDDWDDYMLEVMRGAGRDVRGWVLWDDPAGNGPLRIEPKRFAEMAARADKWRRVYSPHAPLLLGGLSRQSAVPYLTQLAEHKALERISGVNVRLDVGRLSPEDARVPTYLRELRSVLDGATKPAANGSAPVAGAATASKTILLTDLDWAVEKGDGGLAAFDQAAYLVRSDLLMHQLGLRSALSIRNEDAERLGTGLAYRRELSIPPLKEKLLTYQVKPAWHGLARTREWLSRLGPRGAVDVQDVVPGRTRCLLYERRDDGKAVAIVWRNDDPGSLSFAATGRAVESAEDLLGATVPPSDGEFAIGKLPVVFVLASGTEPAAEALARLLVRDDAPAVWPQKTIAAFPPKEKGRSDYVQQGGEPALFAGTTVTGEISEWPGLRFPNGGSERFEVDVPSDADLVLRKRYLLEGTGHRAELFVADGQPVGTWDLRPSDPQLAGGPREAVFVVDRRALAGRKRVRIEVRYDGRATTGDWVALAAREKEYPLSALGPIHADQNVGHLRIARNVVGEKLKIDATSYANGLGVMARSILEYPLGGKFARFTAEVGVDAATEGRGSVVFEVHADGRRLWTSGVMSGLDRAKKVDVDVRGAQRLRLVVGDGGDGSKFDAADWCSPTLHRE